MLCWQNRIGDNWIPERAASWPCLYNSQKIQSHNQQQQGKLMAPSFPDSSQNLIQSPFSPLFDCEMSSKRLSSAALDRCTSEQALQAADAGSHTLLNQVLALCRCTLPAAAQLSHQLRLLRATYPAAVAATSPEAATYSTDMPSVVGLSGSHNLMNIEAMARELLAAGYLVQVRDGAQQERAKNARSCLQNLRHRYIVCLGWRNCAASEPEYLPEPLVVEPCLREQFTIAHPTAQYEALLQAVPLCFVGPVGKLETLVKLLSEQMVISYKQQGLPVPPWRTRQALLSKWSPPALAELAAKIRNVRRMSFDMEGTHHTAAAQVCHPAVGSAPPAAETAYVAESVQAHAAEARAAGMGPHLSAEQLMSILPPEMQQQLLHLAARDGQSTAVAGQAAGQAPNLEYSCKVMQPQAVATHCSSVNSELVPTSAVAGALRITGGVGCGQGCEVTADGAASAATGSATYQLQECSPATADVFALLAAANSPDCGVDSTGSLKFTRKASAEWKNNRSSSRKIKGLLAAALKRPPCSRTNLAPATPAVGSSDKTCCDASVPVQQRAAGNAAGPVFCSHPDAGGHTGSNALIRRTRYRTSGEEPWRHIMTVKLGAYAAQQAAAQQVPAPHTSQQK